jgi:hypothetical protein
LQTGLACRANARWISIAAADVAMIVPSKPELSGENHFFPAARNRNAKQALIVAGPVRIRRVEEIAAEIECALDRSGRFHVIGRAIRVGHSEAA